MKNIVLYIVICSALLLSSCMTNEIDLNQVKKLKFKPKASIAFLNIKLQAKDIVKGTVETKELNQTSEFNGFNEKGIRNAKSVDFKFKSINQIDREFTVDISFIDKDNTDTFKFKQMKVPAKELAFTLNKSIILTNKLRSTRFVKISVKMLPSTDGGILDTADPEYFSFQSGVDIKMNF